MQRQECVSPSPGPIVRATLSRSCALHQHPSRAIHPAAVAALLLSSLARDCNHLGCESHCSCSHYTQRYSYSTTLAAHFPSRPPDHHPSLIIHPQNALPSLSTNSLTDSQPRQPANLDQHPSVSTRHVHCPEIHGLAATHPYMPQGQDLL